MGAHLNVKGICSYVGTKLSAQIPTNVHVETYVQNIRTRIPRMSPLIKKVMRNRNLKLLFYISRFDVCFATLNIE